jgi:cation:H+ antiporter
LTAAMVLFLCAAAAVFYCGSLLGKYGDALAELTGWGRLFVGSIFIALATSLPELLSSISAIRLDPPNPSLSLGTILGSNMLAMFTLALVALLFGSRQFLRRISPEQSFLILLAIALTSATILFGAMDMEFSLWNVGWNSIVILSVYVVGMRIVLMKRPQAQPNPKGEIVQPIQSQRVWLTFGAAALGLIVAAPLLVYSTDQIATITGVDSSTLGILAIAIVTTMPEASSAIAAARIGATDLAIGSLFGSCAINVTILAFTDPFYRNGVLINQMEGAHFVTGGIAVGLMLAGLLLILSRNRLTRTAAAGGLAFMIATYLTGATIVATLGTPDK